MPLTDTPTDSHAETDQGSKDPRWFYKEPQDFNSDCRELLEKYSHIPSEDVLSHVLAIRDRAWDIHPYPCIGRFRFLDLSISSHPSYPRILSFLKEPQSQHTILDLGCCFAQDMRKLVHDGVPSENIYACDLEQSFLDLGYELFKDSDTMKGHLFTANALAEEDAALDKLEGKIDVASVSSFLHLFGWDEQLKICKRIIKMLKPQKGSMVFGRQVGILKGREMENMPGIRTRDPKRIWRHDVETFAELWNVAGRETDTKWKTWGTLDQGDGMGVGHFAERNEIRRLRFEVERLE